MSRIFGAMITQILRRIVASIARQRLGSLPRTALPKREEWQGEFLFVPPKPPLRYDAHCGSVMSSTVDHEKTNHDSRRL